MKVIIFGSTGMVGQGVLRECILDSKVERVLTVVRTPSNTKNKKVEELVHSDFYNFSAVKSKFQDYDACFFCLGVTSAGMSEENYKRITHDMAVAAAEAVINPKMTFVFVSGAGADSSEKGPVMWARIKGKAENAILKMPFKSAYVFRPGVIQPMNGIKSRTQMYNLLYPVLFPLVFLWKLISPGSITSTHNVGRAMINIAANGAPKKILTNSDINLASVNSRPRILN